MYVLVIVERLLQLVLILACSCSLGFTDVFMVNKSTMSLNLQVCKCEHCVTLHRICVT